MNILVLITSALVMVSPVPKPKYESLLHVLDGSSVAWLKPLSKPSANDNTFIKITPLKAPISDEEILDEAIYECKYADPAKADKKLLRMLLAVEKKYGVPNSLRGMLLAAACHESGYNPKAKGDRKFSKSKKKPMAVGLFQMWPWWEKTYKIKRTNPEQVAHAYMKHIKKQLKGVRKKCGKRAYRSKKKRWVIAWVTAIRAPAKKNRCYERPKFYKIVKKWHRSIKAHRKQVNDCMRDGSDGCGC